MMHPVLREGIARHFLQRRLFRAYFFSVVFLAAVQCLLVFLSAADPQAWHGRAYLFQVSAVVAVVLGIYLSLRVGNQEFSPWEEQPLARWSRQERPGLRDVASAQIGLLALHSLAFMAVSFPLLYWAAAVGRADGEDIFAAIFLLVFYSAVYGIWGLVASSLWYRLESRQFFTRCLLAFSVFLSAFLYLPLNPAAYLLFRLEWIDLGASVSTWGFAWSPEQIHMGLHLFLLGAGLFGYLWLLRREGYP